MRVCCFCSDEEDKPGSGKENLLLWAHYTDSHKGVCLVFDVLADPSFFVTPLRVIYQDAYPEYNHLRDEKKLADRLIKPKSAHWKYENEIRVIKQKNGLHEFARTSLVEVAFGAKCPSSDVERLKLLAKNNGFSGTKFTKAEVMPDKYGLRFTEV